MLISFFSTSLMCWLILFFSLSGLCVAKREPKVFPLNVDSPFESDDPIDNQNVDFVSFVDAMPSYVGAAYIGESWTSWPQGNCFKANLARAVLGGNNSIEVQLKFLEPVDKLCSDIYVFSTLKNFYFNVFSVAGYHSFKLTNLDANDLEITFSRGVRVFLFKNGAVRTTQGLYKLANMITSFLSDNPPTPHQAAVNKEFLEDYMDVTFEKRNVSKIPLTEDQIPDGSVFLTGSFDPFSTILMAVTGGSVAHSALALRQCDGCPLNVIETQTGPGVHVTSNYSAWIEGHIHYGEMVAVLFLHPTIRSRFNRDKAWALFEILNGTSYGFSTAWTSFLDVTPDSFPKWLEAETLEMIINVLHFQKPDAVEALFSEIFNNRLETLPGSSLPVFDAIYESWKQRKLSFGQVLSLPESDSFAHQGSPAYICSALVVVLLRAGGVFDGFNINVREFTPRDISTLQIFDTPDNLPLSCRLADPGLPVCQLLGKTHLFLKDFNSVPLQNYICERCPLVAPTFPRSVGC